MIASIAWRGPMPRASRAPLSVRVSLARNPLRTLPTLFVVLAASFGVATIVILANSILRTASAPNDYLAGAVAIEAPGADIDAIARDAAGLAGVAGVERDTILYVRGRSIGTQMWFPLHAIEPARQPAFLARYGAALASGRMPRAGSAEVALHREFAANRGIAIGDTVGGPDDLEPIPMTVVGLLDGPRWIGVVALPEVPAAVAKPSLLAFVADDADRANVEAALRERWGAAVRLRHWSLDTSGADGASAENVKGDLRLMLGFMVGVNAAVLSAIGGFLGFIYFRQRRAEFVLLAILGWGKRRLARRMINESAVLIGIGWLLGLGAAWGFANVLDALMLRPRGIVTVLADVEPALYTIPMAAITFAISVAVVVAAFARFDPISQMESRG